MVIIFLGLDGFFVGLFFLEMNCRVELVNNVGKNNLNVMCFERCIQYLLMKVFIVGLKVVNIDLDKFILVLVLKGVMYFDFNSLDFFGFCLFVVNGMFIVCFLVKFYVVLVNGG